MRTTESDPTLFDPAAVRITNHRLAAGSGSCQRPYLLHSAASSKEIRRRHGPPRLPLNDRHRLTLRSYIQYYNRAESSTPGNILAVNAGKQGKFFNEVLNHTWTISPSLSMRFRCSGTRCMSTTGARSLTLLATLSAFRSTSTSPSLPGICYSEGLNANGGFSTPYYELTDEMRRSWGFSDSLTKTIGNHTLSPGPISGIRAQANLPTIPQIRSLASPATPPASALPISFGEVGSFSRAQARSQMSPATFSAPSVRTSGVSVPTSPSRWACAGIRTLRQHPKTGAALSTFQDSRARCSPNAPNGPCLSRR